uniref:hypothetical protein n=1 Tax=Crassiphycus crassissimus TaxID=2783451 RepID=UPI001D103F9C|nr:hypothetical protein LK098_pgp117 [Crassiphycus crassissimus]UAD84973.1 hypothetical protein [Crassiphycus crassissimus]
MNLMQNFLLDKYIHSPKTWLHKVKSRYKTYFMFIYLYVILYTDEKNIASNICLYLMFFLYFQNINNNYKNFLFHISYIVCILIYIIIILIELLSNIYIIQLSYVYYCLIYIFNKYILQLRILLIIVHYFFTINIIFLATTYEDVTFSFFELLKKYQNNKANKIIFISTFASQALANITKKIRYMLLTIRIKKITKLFKFKYYIYLISKLIQEIYNDIYRISTTLYTRELNDNLIYITFIYE